MEVAPQKPEPIAVAAPAVSEVAASPAVTAKPDPAKKCSKAKKSGKTAKVQLNRVSGVVSSDCALDKLMFAEMHDLRLSTACLVGR